MNSRLKLAIALAAGVVASLYLDEKYLAGAILAFGLLYNGLWSIEVKLNLLLDEKNLRATEDDFNR